MSTSPTGAGRPGNAGRRSDGFTLVELMITLGISFVMASAIYLMLGHGRRIENRVTQESSSMRELRLQMKRMTDELQEGTRLVYPEPGQDSDCGVAFVNAKGQTVFYYAREAADETDSKALWRSNVDPSDCEQEEAIVHRVRWFRVTTAPAAPGRTASRVNLDLAACGSEATTVPANIVTSVFLRSLEKYVPEDATNVPWR